MKTKPKNKWKKHLLQTKNGQQTNNVQIYAYVSKTHTMEEEKDSHYVSFAVAGKSLYWDTGEFFKQYFLISTIFSGL